MRALTRGVAVAIVAWAHVAGAQQPPFTSRDASFNPQLFHPAPGGEEFVTVEPAAPLHHEQVGAGAWLDWARNPFSVLTYSSRTHDPYGASVQVQSNVLAGEAWLGVGVWERLQVALSLPMTLYQNGQPFDGDYPPPDGIHIRPPTGFALGDPRLYLKLFVWGKPRGFQFAISHWLSAPLGNDDRFGGERHFSGFAGEPRLIAEWIGGRWSAAVNVGFLWRVHGSSYFSTGAGDELTYAGAVAVDLARARVRLIAELYGHTDFSPDADYAGLRPLELDVAARLRLGRGVALTAGVGVGVLGGNGAPLPRVLAGMSWVLPLRDRDGDGIPDNRDLCPSEPEDRDGYRDDDGCPDPDNDGDTIPDVRDKCPNEPEDLDGFQDDDGCPDPDNDKDGIDDLHDKCPNDAEDGKGAQPHDGCPLGKSDTDADGIPDAVDKCPTEPEDIDGFEDEDGCPDPDNDGDGIPDQFDECPNEPEDMNGVDDEDGCPDYGAAGVRLKDEEIVLKHALDFDGGALTPASVAQLAGVAVLLKAKPSLIVRIEGYAAAGTSEEAASNQSHAEAQAVRRQLVKQGIAPARLSAIGYGVDADKPTARIELHLVK